MYKLFTRFAPYIDHIISWGVSGSGWQGSYVLFDSQSNANAGYYAAANPDRYILGHSYLDDYFDGEYEKLQDDYVIDLGDLGTYIPKGSVMSSIDITTAPSKTVYTEGESFDPTGMVVTATYANGNKKAITDYTISPDGALTPDVTSITVTYTENGVTKTAALPITVNLDLSRVEKVEEQINGLPSVEDIVIDNEEHIKTVADAKAASSTSEANRDIAYWLSLARVLFTESCPWKPTTSIRGRPSYNGSDSHSVFRSRTILYIVRALLRVAVP